MYLCDSDILIDFLKEDDHTNSILTPLFEAGLWISLIAVGEVYDGVLWGRDPVQAEGRLRSVLLRMALVGLDLQTVRGFADLRGRLRSAGMLIPDNDLFIAATALRHDLTLVTRNRRHFDRVPGLRIHEPESGR